MTDQLDEDFSVTLEIDGTLDLHQFSPKDVKTLVPDYLLECLQKEILEVRIIHGKAVRERACSDGPCTPS